MCVCVERAHAGILPAFKMPAFLVTPCIEGLL